jgi:membrane protein implicated in regulation of membrane protease activity
MNRAFLIVGVPAMATSFFWLVYGWGWQRAMVVTGFELAAIVAAVIYLLQRQNAEQGDPSTKR